MGAVGLKCMGYCWVTVHVVGASPVESPRVTVYVPGIVNVSEKNEPVLVTPFVSDQ